MYITHARGAKLIQLTRLMTDSCHVDKCQCHNTTPCKLNRQPFPDVEQLSEFTLALIAVIPRSRASGHDIRLNLGTAGLFVTVNCLANRTFICFANSVLLGGHFFQLGLSLEVHHGLVVSNICSLHNQVPSITADG